jgi:hypothetical protein
MTMKMRPDVAKRIDKAAQDLKSALAFWYERDGELRLATEVDGLRDTIAIRINAGLDDASRVALTVDREHEDH